MVDLITDFVSNLSAHIARWIKRHLVLLASLLLAILIIYSILWVLTIRIQRQAVEFIRDALQCELKVKRTSVTPALRIILEDIQITSPESTLKLPDFTAGKIMLAVDVPSLFAGKIKLSEVFMADTSVTIYQEPDGSYNLARWFNRVTVCDSTPIGKVFPGRINIRNGRILMEPPPGAQWHETIELGRIDGIFGLTENNDIGIDLKFSAFKSSIAIRGGFRPCVAEGLDLNGSSEVFDFSEVQRVVNRMLYRVDEDKLDLPGGTGRLSFSVKGGFLSPYITGNLSLRDFDFRFAYMEKVVDITDFRAGIGTEKITGSGSVDFSDNTMPFHFSFVMEELSLHRLFQDLTGFRYAPSGSLSGFARISGSLKEAALVVDNGNITVTDGVLKLPALTLADQTGKGKVPIELPFQKITSRIATRNGHLAFINIAATAEDWIASGSGSLSELFSLGGMSKGVGYNINIELEADDALAIAKRIPSLRGKVGGNLKATLQIDGTTGSLDGFGGSGYIAIHNGFFRNPYQKRGSHLRQTIDFDIAEANFLLSPQTLHLTGASIIGEGLDIDTSGIISFDGKLELTAKAGLSPERAIDFVGIAHYVSGLDLVSLVTYHARCDISGDIRDPVATWQEPSLTRWQY